MVNTLIGTPHTHRSASPSLTAWAASAHSAYTAPVRTEQGTGLSFAGMSTPLAVTAQVAFGARVTDLPGLRPRGGPV